MTSRLFDVYNVDSDCSGDFDKSLAQTGGSESAELRCRWLV